MNKLYKYMWECNTCERKAFRDLKFFSKGYCWIENMKSLTLKYVRDKQNY